MITPTLVATLRAELIGNSLYATNVEAQNYAAIATQLNSKPLIANPTPQANIPKPFTVDNIFAAITPAEALTIYKITGIKQDVAGCIASGDTTSLNNYLLMIEPLLSPTSLSNLQALLSQQIPDPNYQSQIPGQSRAEFLGIYPVTAAQVQYVLTS